MSVFDPHVYPDWAVDSHGLSIGFSAYETQWLTVFDHCYYRVIAVVDTKVTRPNVSLGHFVARVIIAQFVPRHAGSPGVSGWHLLKNWAFVLDKTLEERMTDRHAELDRMFATTVEEAKRIMANFESYLTEAML